MLTHHALLFVGADADTKLAAAKKIAQDYLCRTGSQALWEAGTHPDYFLIVPEEEQHSIKIEQIRELNAKLQQKPQHAEYQVAIIAPAEAMTTAAANALLKTLEEPPGKVLLILITEQLPRLLPTIRSRCQLRRFTEATPDDLFIQQRASMMQQQLLDLRKRILSPIDVAAEWAKEDLKPLLNVFLSVVFNLIKSQPDLNQQRKEYYFLDELMRAKREADTHIAINSALLFEKLFMSWTTL